ncbi:MAG: hypothetical protein IPL28_12800 [Chloroflexi bacterium]|nr:hypothetical protein [Chloroflexota bacterium]
MERLATLLEERVPQQAPRQSKRVYVDWQHPWCLSGIVSVLLAINDLKMIIQRPQSRLWGTYLRWRENLAALGLLVIPAFSWLRADRL